MTKVLISEMEPNQDIATCLVVMEKQLRTARNGTLFLTLKLLDKTGEITGRVWENAEEVCNAVPVKTAVFLRGRSEKYREELQLNIREIRPLETDEVDASDFLPACPVEPGVLFEGLQKILGTVKRRSLRQLSTAFLSDQSLMKRFRIAPAAKSMHHAYLGGLLEHTLGVTRLVSELCELYPVLDRDQLLVGAFLHDIGKIDEFVYDLFIDYSDAGRLLGHMVLGVEILEKKSRTLKTPHHEEMRALKHLILSHHGEAEFGAVKPPMTREAFVLHAADDLDAKLNFLGRILEAPGDPGQLWTGYQPLFDRFFYRGAPFPAERKPSPGKAGPEEGITQLSLWADNRQKSPHESS